MNMKKVEIIWDGTNSEEVLKAIGYPDESWMEDNKIRIANEAGISYANVGDTIVMDEKGLYVK